MGYALAGSRRFRCFLPELPRSDTSVQSAAVRLDLLLATVDQLLFHGMFV